MSRLWGGPGDGADPFKSVARPSIYRSQETKKRREKMAKVISMLMVLVVVIAAVAPAAYTAVALA